ncbi:MAG: hypothetical protein ACKVQS_14945 [Fimbriimonadaceae bacterium]
MMLKRIGLLILTAAAMGAVASTQEAVTLRLKLTEGDTLTTKMTINVDFQGTPITVKGKNILTVKSAKDGKYVLEAASKETVIDVGGGQTMEQPDSVVRTTQNEMGQILAMEGDEVSPEAIRMATAFNVFYPEKGVKVGDKFERTVEGDTKLGTRKMTLKYEVTERKEWQGFDVVVLKVDQTEDGDLPISMAGTVSINVKNGLPVLMDFAFKNMPAQGMTFDGTYHSEAVK